MSRAGRARRSVPAVCHRLCGRKQMGFVALRQNKPASRGESKRVEAPVCSSAAGRGATCRSATSSTTLSSHRPRDYSKRSSAECHDRRMARAVRRINPNVHRTVKARNATRSVMGSPRTTSRVNLRRESPARMQCLRAHPRARSRKVREVIQSCRRRIGRQHRSRRGICRVSASLLPPCRHSTVSRARRRCRS